MLLERVPPSEACRPPAPKGRKDSALEKKNRAATLSWPLRNSRSQLAVNWSSVYRPGLLRRKGAVFRVTRQVSGSTLTPGVPGSEGTRYPELSANWLLWNCSSLTTTGSMVMGTAAHPAGLAAVGAVAGARKIAGRSGAGVAGERSGGRLGEAGWLSAVRGEGANGWRVAW